MPVAAGEQALLKEWKALRTTAAKQVRSLRPDALTPEAASRVLDDAIAIEKAAAAAKLLLARRLAEQRGANAAADDLAQRSGTSKQRAKDVVDAGKRLKDQPEVEDALRDGDLSQDQAALVSDAAAVNPSATGSLLDKAKREPLGGLKAACGLAKAAADPDEDATHRRIHNNRYFRTGRDTEGAFTGGMRGTTRGGSSFLAHLQPFRDRIFKENRAAGRRDTSEQMDFDALMAMARAAYENVTGRAATTEPDAMPMPPTTPKGPANVYVVVNWDALVNRHEPGDESAYIAGFGPVPTSVVREVLDDAFLVGVVMRGTEVVKIKRFGRRFGAEIRDALLVKHRFRCSTPGCTNWIRLEMDHLQPYRKKGPTTYANGDPKCKDCHKKKTAADRLFWDDTG